MPKVSVVIVNFNTKKLTLECVKSIKSSNPKSKYEIIIVDNGSEEKIPESKDYKLISNTVNLGFAKANNLGIRSAKGEYVLLLNSDTIVKKGTFDKLIEFAQNHSDAGVIAPKLLNKDGSLQSSVFRLPTTSRAVRQYWFGEKGLLDKYAPSTTTEVESAVMAAFLITPKALKKVGDLDKKYFLYYEDLDYCRRVRQAGLNIYYYRDAEVVHLHGASGGVNKLLVESAKKYHGLVGYYIYTFILWSGQKLQKLLK